MSNLSVLDRNIIHALDDDAAETMYLRLRERMTALQAEVEAYEWRGVSSFLSLALSKAAELHGVPFDPDIVRFLADRFFYKALEA